MSSGGISYAADVVASDVSSSADADAVPTDVMASSDDVFISSNVSASAADVEPTDAVDVVVPGGVDDVISGVPVSAEAFQ